MDHPHHLLSRTLEHSNILKNLISDPENPKSIGKEQYESPMYKRVDSNLDYSGNSGKEYQDEDVIMCASESEVANLINDIANTEMFEQTARSSGDAYRSSKSHDEKEGMCIASTSRTVLPTVTQSIKNEIENVVIHITLPEKSEFEVILHRGEQKNDGAQEKNYSTETANKSLGGPVESTNSSSKLMPSSIISNGLANLNKSEENDFYKMSDEDRTGEEDRIDDVERPNEGKVQKMIDFFKNLPQE